VKSDAPGKQKEGGEQEVEIKAEPVPVDSKFQRKCPQCGGQLNLLELENMWQCFTCGHEELSAGAAPGTGGLVTEPASVPAAEPVSDPSLFSTRQPVSKSHRDYKPTKKKDCPVCKKKMYWYPDTKAWRCPSCYYERRI
jgi:ribosomal protein L37AE/L43A